MKTPAKALLILGALLSALGPGLGLLGTVLGMMYNFQTLEAEGMTNISALSSGISWVLIMTVGGFIVGGIGVIILILGFLVWLASRKVSQTPSPSVS